MKKLQLFLLLLIAISNISLAQNRIVARGAEPGELYLTGAWYGIYNPIMPWYYDTLQTAIYRITENGKKLTIQYDADYFANPEIIMQPQHILADATAGVVYNKSNYSKNSYPYTSLWVSFDYGKNWIFREENIGQHHYYSSNFEGLIYRNGSGIFKSSDYANTWNMIKEQSFPSFSEVFFDECELFCLTGSGQYFLYHTYDCFQNYTTKVMNEQFVFGQIWGRFPDVYRGGLPGEVYVSSMFPEENYNVTYKVSFSADTGHTFRHVYVSELLGADDVIPIFMSDREPGAFYILKGYEVEDLNPWGHHSKVCIEYYRDYGETLVATYCHDLHKNYGKTCEPVNNLVSEKCGDNCVLLSWSEPESSLPVEEYWVYRNAESRRQKAESRMEEDELVGVTSGTTFLDENLSNGSYEYYVVVHYTNNCISDSSNHVVVNIEVGINERENVDKIIIYPNPTTGELRITNYELRIEGVEIYDIYGKMIEIPHCVRNDVIPSVAQRSEESRTINIAHLSKGIYFVKIATEKGIVTKKVIKY